MYVLVLCINFAIDIEVYHYFTAICFLSLIKFVSCLLLSFSQNGHYDDETCSQPIADGYLCLHCVCTLCRASFVEC